MMTRRKRSDRNHIIYQITLGDDVYIGVTAKTQSTVLKSVKSRLAKHFQRAHTEQKAWALCNALRTLQSKDDIVFSILAVIRGKAEAHSEERRLIRAHNPSLNSDKRGV